MIVAYYVYGQDNLSEMYDGQAVTRCSRCGFVTEPRFVAPSFELERRQYDWSQTNDGCCIVSRRVKELAERHGYGGLEFLDLPSEPDFFRLIVSNYVEFDTRRRETILEDYCDVCGRFRTVAGATPAFLKRTRTPLAEGIYRTDIEFGTGDEQSPLYLVATETRNLMKREKLKGLTFGAVEATGASESSSAVMENS